MAAKKKKAAKKAGTSSKKKQARRAGARTATVTVGELHELHTKATNVVLGVIDLGDLVQARRLQTHLMSLSVELRDLNDQVIRSNATVYRQIATSFGKARKAAAAALEDVQKAAKLIVDIAELVSKLAKVAVAL